ncbi:MAG: sugar isomerase [Verrucomicrobiia bacterium]
MNIPERLQATATSLNELHPLPLHPRSGFPRRDFLRGVGAASVALAAWSLARPQLSAAPAGSVPAGQPFPRGSALRVKPILVYDMPHRSEQTSWRSYGGIQTPAAAKEEAGRIERELHALAGQAEFPVQFQPVEVLESQSKLASVAVNDTDACIVYAAGYCVQWPLKVPMIMFVRHESGPFYLGFEIAHWRFLRQNGDTLAVEGFDADDVVVDSQDELLWRLRALYGVRNSKGTKMLTIGGLEAYSTLAQENGPRIAKELWGYEFVNVTDQEFAQRLKAAQVDEAVLRTVEQETAALLSMPNIALETERKFVFNSCLAMHVCRQLLQETGASNFGFARCMGRDQITMLGTPPCLVLSLANDEGYTAYCHTDLSHTMPGVLLRWIASRPTFVCNSHFPHDGRFFVAHCQAPRRMNGRDYEPATLMTHYESDFGAACKTHYTRNQVVTAVVPNLACSKWQGFRGKIVNSPSYPACRSQMDILVDGDWKRLARELEGFHTQVVYGDYVREVGYALKKLGGKIGWVCYS